MSKNPQKYFINESVELLRQIEKTRVLYMCSSFWLLGVESRDFFQAEKERTAWKAGQIHKMPLFSLKTTHVVRPF